MGSDTITLKLDTAREARIDALSGAMRDVVRADRPDALKAALSRYGGIVEARTRLALDEAETRETEALQSLGMTAEQAQQAKEESLLSDIVRVGRAAADSYVPGGQAALGFSSITNDAVSPGKRRIETAVNDAAGVVDDAVKAEFKEAVTRSGVDPAVLSKRLHGTQSAIDDATIGVGKSGNSGLFGAHTRWLDELGLGDKSSGPGTVSADTSPLAKVEQLLIEVVTIMRQFIESYRDHSEEPVVPSTMLTGSSTGNGKSVPTQTNLR